MRYIRGSFRSRYRRAMPKGCVQGYLALYQVALRNTPTSRQWRVFLSVVSVVSYTGIARLNPPLQAPSLCFLHW